MLWVLVRSARQGTSNEYPQHVFIEKLENIITFWLKKAPYQELCCQTVSIVCALLNIWLKVNYGDCLEYSVFCLRKMNDK